MTVDTLKSSNKIVFEMIAGSHAYGTNIPESDIDIRGVYLNKNEEVFSLFPFPKSVSDEKNDITYYELREYILLAMDNNPNVIEYLYISDDCIRINSPIWQKILDNRHFFISKKCKATYSGYAFAQIKRAKGQNKWISNKKPERKPILEDFCWFVPNNGNVWKPIPVTMFKNEPHVSLNNTDYLSLKVCKVSGFEHLAYTYRLYGPFYGEDAGVFSGGKPITKSISKEDEDDKFIGMLIVNHDAYEQELRDWKNYWEWKKNRNEARWVAQEKGEMDFDSKNMSHCIRLMLSGINILKNHEPLVRLTGKDLELVKDIRTGKYSYDEIIAMSTDLENELNVCYETSTLRNEPDRKAINNLYLEIIGIN